MKQSSLLNDVEKSTQKKNYSNRLECMKRKGTFPYSWAQSTACYDYQHLVEKKAFFQFIDTKTYNRQRVRFCNHGMEYFQYENYE